MSSFSVQARRVHIEPHPNADNLELAIIDGYQSIVLKNQFVDGDLALYIPEQALVPDDILEEIGLLGRLHGAEKNRVKAIKLRGEISQGLVVKLERLSSPIEEYDYAEDLGIQKWAPQLKFGSTGKGIAYTDFAYHVSDIRTYTDIENIKGFPNELQEGENVHITEKIHGTCTIFYFDGEKLHVSSKGMAGKEFALKEFTANRDGVEEENLYWNVAKQYQIEENMRTLYDRLGFTAALKVNGLILFGETFGRVQDLKYGHNNDYVFRAFDLAMIVQERMYYFEWAVGKTLIEAQDIPTVPTLYSGPWSVELGKDLAKGDETVSGSSLHIREGIVIRPYVEREARGLGRVILKMINEDYLLRKGETTEFE